MKKIFCLFLGIIAILLSSCSKNISVKFIVDGDVVSEYVMDEEEKVKYPNDPVKEPTNKFVYEFDKWNLEKDGKGNCVYTASFTTSDRLYVVKWVNFDDSLIYSEEYKYNGIVTYKDYKPKYKDASKKFVGFDGFNDNYIITKDVVFKALYEDCVYYNVTYLNYDDTVLLEGGFYEGTSFEYSGETPIKNSPNEKKTYVFTGWDKQVDEANKKITYKALFEEKNVYKVRYFHQNGKLLFEDKVIEGTPSIFEGKLPEKNDKEETYNEYHSYKFKNWDKDTSKVVEDMDVHPVFEMIVVDKTVNITFKNYDGTVLKVDKVKIGNLPRWDGPTPKKTDSGNYTYSFNGWDKSIVEATEDTVYTATYREIYVEPYEKVRAYIRNNEGGEVNIGNDITATATSDSILISSINYNQNTVISFGLNPEVIFGECVAVINVYVNNIKYYEASYLVFVKDHQFSDMRLNRETINYLPNDLVIGVTVTALATAKTAINNFTNYLIRNDLPLVY